MQAGQDKLETEDPKNNETTEEVIHLDKYLPKTRVLPKSVQDWTREQVGEWLENEMGFPNLKIIFNENVVHGKRLLRLIQPKYSGALVILVPDINQRVQIRSNIASKLGISFNFHIVERHMKRIFQDSHYDEHRKCQKLEWEKKTPIENISNFSNGYSKIEKVYLKDSGLADDDPIVLYERKCVKNQVSFLDKEVMLGENVGWILGPTGTGKSIIMYHYLLNLSKNKDCIITWVCLSQIFYPVYVRFEQGCKSSRGGTWNYRGEIMEMLNDTPSGRYHFVVLDGYVEIPQHTEIMADCDSWFFKDRKHRRLVISCSMSSRMSQDEEDINHRVKEFFVESWMIEEYYDAIKDSTFFNSVKGKLDSLENRTDKELIDSKYYYAGGSARFMFGQTRKDVMQDLDTSVETCKDIAGCIEGRIFGNRLFAIDPSVNRLFSIFKESNWRNISFVSEYAACQAAIVVMVRGRLMMESLVQSLVNSLKLARHKMDGWFPGWFLKMWVLAGLRVEGIQLYNDRGLQSDFWPRTILKDFDVNNLNPGSFDSSPIWLRPLQWNQGGYDAVYVDKGKGLVRFIQVTRGNSTHSFKLRFFYEFLLNLQQVPDVNFVVEKLEIFYLVNEKNIREITIDERDISDQGLLTAFGWKKGFEQSEIRVFGIDEF